MVINNYMAITGYMCKLCKNKWHHVDKDFELFQEHYGANFPPPKFYSYDEEYPLEVNMKKEIYKAGMKEVVDWVNENVNWRTDAPYKSTIDPSDWQSKLKEWGL